MKKVFHCIAIFYFCSHMNFAAAQKSTDTNLNVAKLNLATDLLDQYSGEQASLEQARLELESVLKSNPRSAPAHREMARYFIMRGHMSYQNFQTDALEKADSSIKKAIEINPKFAEAYVLRGHLYRLMKRRGDAIIALEKAERIGTTDPWLQMNWADLLLDEEKYEDAAARYKNVLGSKTTNKKVRISAFEGLIRVYENVNDLDRADETYRRLLAFNPAGAWSYGNYAQFLLCEKDDYESAIGRAREALSIMDYAAGRHWLASALYRKWAQHVLAGEPTKGESAFQEAKTLADPFDVVARVRDCPPLSSVTIALGRNNIFRDIAPPKR